MTFLFNCLLFIHFFLFFQLDSDTHANSGDDLSLDCELQKNNNENCSMSETANTELFNKFRTLMNRTERSKAVLIALDDNTLQAENAASYALLAMYKTLKPPNSFADVLIPVPPNEVKGRAKKSLVGSIFSGKEFAEALERKEEDEKKKEEEKEQRLIDREASKKRKIDDKELAASEREEKKKIRLEREKNIRTDKEVRIRIRKETKEKKEREKFEKQLKKIQKETEKKQLEMEKEKDLNLNGNQKKNKKKILK